MKSKILVAIGFIVCFAVGFVCGMYAQSRLVAGNDEDSGVFVFVQKNLFVANKNNNHDDLSCPDGSTPDGNGCCGDEVYTDLGENGFNCCPPGDGDCFPPIM